MPRNTSGGSGHKAQSNSEGSKARNNRVFIDELLDDIKNGENTEVVYVGRVLRRMGSGSMAVMYFSLRKGDEDEDEGMEIVQQIIPMRGGVRGKGKSSSRVLDFRVQRMKLLQYSRENRLRGIVSLYRRQMSDSS